MNFVLLLRKCKKKQALAAQRVIVVATLSAPKIKDGGNGCLISGSHPGREEAEGKNAERQQRWRAVKQF